MKTIQSKLLFFLLFLFSYFLIYAQKSPLEIKYLVMDLHTLRYYPFTENADSIILRIIEKNENYKSESDSNVYEKTAVDFVVDKSYLQDQIAYSSEKNDMIYKNIIKPYQPWFQYAAPLEDNENEIVLTLGLHQEEKKGNAILFSENEGIYKFIGKQNVAYLLDEMFGDVDLFQNKNNILFTTYKSPLKKKNKDLYNYFVSSKNRIEGQFNYEIVFFPKDNRENAFTGYLYIMVDENEYHLQRAFFTMSNWNNLNFIKDILLTQTFESRKNKDIPQKKEYLFSIGDDTRGAFLVNRMVDYSGNIQPLTLSEKQVKNVVAMASKTTSFRNLTNLAHFLLTDHLVVGGENGIFEWGPVFQTFSYNEMEGFRLRVGGNTTLNLNKQWLLGGYLVYGTKDEKLKYRGDIIYSFSPKDKDIWEFPKRLLSFSYIHDLNIPGQNLLTTRRDRIFYSFSHLGTDNMSLQKLASIDYEQELESRLSFKIGGKYLHDKPMGKVRYPKSSITTSEVNFSFRYSPYEAFLQNRGKRVFFRKGAIELELNHRMGLKGVFNSDYYYHITDFNAYKTFLFPKNVGKVDIHLSAGKVWNRVPFPLLFIPSGNQSYIFEQNDYNQIDFFEFATDNFVSGKINFLLNWSPFQLFSDNKIKTTFGSKMIYGPLSEKNDPNLHSELFLFNGEIKPLGNTPYVELNIGFANVFKWLRIEWVQRMTYLENDMDKKKKRGSLFVTTNFLF